jgi:membrane dipeptidase
MTGLAGFGYFFTTSKALAPREPDQQKQEFLDRLFEETLVFDGVVNLGMRRGRGTAPMIPGEIKKLSGINVGNHTTRVRTLAERNRWVGERSQALLHVLKASDIERARTTNRYGIIFYAQSEAELHGSLEPLSEWKAGGLRAFQISFSDNELGGGTGSDDAPLTAFGQSVVKELNRLRLVVDVSHSGRRTTLDVAHCSGAPVTANHANARWLTPHLRNKSDQELKAIAATGGVVGATGINRFLLRDPRRPATLEDFVTHVDYMVQLIGIDHVGLSSDSNVDGSHRYEVDYADLPLSEFARWRHVTGRLRDRGYGREDLQKILGHNFRRVYEKVLDP